MRTPEEIITEIHHRADGFFDFTGEVLPQYLPFSHAQEFLKPEVTASEWDQMSKSPTPETILSDMRTYMDFAWGKVLDHRGLSASRSVSKMRAWLWLLGDDDLAAMCESEADYPQYGAPILKAICTKYGFEVPRGDGVERMAQGHACTSDCLDGCREL